MYHYLLNIPYYIIFSHEDVYIAAATKHTTRHNNNTTTTPFTMSDFPPQSSALDASNDDNATPSRRRSRHYGVTQNAHLQVLGRDGRDLPLFVQNNNDDDSLLQQNQREQTNTNGSSSSSSWWNGMARRFSRPSPNSNADSGEEEHTIISDKKKMGASLREIINTEGIATAASLQEPLASFPHQQKRSSSLSTTTRAVASSLLLSKTTRSATSHASSSSSSTMYSSALQEEEEEPLSSREEQVMAQSSFFYRDMDDVIPQRRKSSVGGGGGGGVLPPHERSAYRARFQQLNQEFIVQDDLELFSLDLGENQELPSSSSSLAPPPNNNIIQDFSHSSLYYKQDGKVLMKLPKDKVRLVMDPELGQAGILSSACIITAGKNPDSNNNNNNNEYPAFTEISYILTVPPDIYQKVVLELAHKHTTICSSCFVDEDRVAIQVAIGLLIAILLLLFINVLIYPGD